MKKILPFLLTFSLLLTSCQFSLEDFQERPLESLGTQISESFRLTFTDRILTQLNGQNLDLSPEASIADGQLVLPLRPLLEAAGAHVEWDGQGLISYLYDNQVRIQPESSEMLVNGSPVSLVSPVHSLDGRIIGPVRPICEALSIGIHWDESRRLLELSAPLPTDRIALLLNGRSLALGDSLLSVQTRWGAPDRIDPSVYDFTWHVYNRDYRNFVMIGYRADQVCAIYSNAGGFSVQGMPWGAPVPVNSPNIRYYSDDIAGGTITAVLLGEGFDLERTMIPDYSFPLMEAQERESLDLANAFRVAKGLAPLSWDDLLCESGRRHSQDMADRDYFSHTTPEGLEPWDRYRALGGSYTKFGENIYAGHFTALDTHQGWINSPGHREAILDPDFRYLGVGMAYSPDTEYRYYCSQQFLRP